MRCYFFEKNSKVQNYLGKVMMLVAALMISTISFGVKLGTVKGLSRLSNYNKLKDIDVNAITNLQISKNGEVINPGTNFAGVGIANHKGKIIGVYFYKNGKQNGKSYVYYDNGQVYLENEIKNEKYEGEGKSYYDDGQLQSARIYKDDIILLLKKYKHDGSLDFTYTQTSGYNGIMTYHKREGNIETVEKVEASYREKNEGRVLVVSIIFTKNGAFQVYNNKGRLIRDGVYRNDEIVISNKVDKFSGFILQDRTYKVNVEDRDYFFQTLKDFKMKGLTEEFYKGTVELFGSKPYCSSIGMLFVHYRIFKDDPVTDIIGSYLLKISRDAKKTAKKYTELNDNDFLVKYYKTNCKVPSESKLSFVENLEVSKEFESNRNPKEIREFFKNPVIK